MKKMNKGAISIFALLSMMFFLIFIMVAYNNVTQKGKNQVETQEILVRYYKSNRTAADIADAMNGDKSSKGDTSKLKESAQQGVNAGNYVYSNGKVYLIQN